VSRSQGGRPLTGGEKRKKNRGGSRGGLSVIFKQVEDSAVQEQREERIGKFLRDGVISGGGGGGE